MDGSSQDTVKIGVRVRPFVAREAKDGEECVVSMARTATTVLDPMVLWQQSQPGAAPIDESQRKIWETTIAADFAFDSHDPSSPSFGTIHLPPLRHRLEKP